MLDPSRVTDELRARLRAELPEVEEMRDPELCAKVVEAWALALAASSFGAIAEIEPSGNPGVNTLKRGSQTDHIRGVTRLAMRITNRGSHDGACCGSARHHGHYVRPRRLVAPGLGLEHSGGAM
jgi:hypothetical protein